MDLAFICPSSFQLDLQTLYISPISAPFWRKMLENVILPVNTAHYLMKKRRAWRLTFCWVFKAHGFKGSCQQENFSNLTNIVVSVIIIVFPLDLVIVKQGFLSLFWHQKWLLWRSLFPVWMAHWYIHPDGTVWMVWASSQKKVPQKF